MDRSAREFLRKLIETPSPSGFEQQVQKLIRARLTDFVDEIRTDVHGNVISAINPKAPLRVMLAGHCDEIGLMITHIDAKGFLYIATVGGTDLGILGTQHVVIHGPRGPVPGVVGKKAVHLMEPEEAARPVKIKQCWVDIGAKDRKDARKVVEVGNVMTIDRGLVELRNGLIAGRAFDDKVGAWVVVETMRRLRTKKPKVAVYGVTTVQEELGLRGAITAAYGIQPHAGIAIDVGHVSDYPDPDVYLYRAVGDVGLGKGPILHRGANINPVFGRFIEKTAKAKRIPFQMQAEPRATGTDANPIQLSRGGAAAAIISIPNRYMHTPAELVSLRDLDLTVDLLVATLMQMKPGMSFVP